MLDMSSLADKYRGIETRRAQMTKSFDQITKRAVARMTAKAGGDVKAILRIHEKARDHRAHRAAFAFLGSLRRPVSA